MFGTNNLQELLQLLDTIKFDYGQDNLIFVGDLVNKGPRSQEVSKQATLAGQHDSPLTTRSSRHHQPFLFALDIITCAP